jgi:arsenate reductase
MTVLILCTGNSCRSQMAEAYLASLDSRLTVRSAGTNPAGRVHPKAVAAMKEIGIDISAARPKSVDGFLSAEFTYVITVCDNAKETCPVFTGKVKHRLHLGFDDPAEATGPDDRVMDEFRRVRDEIRERFGELYRKEIAPALLP